MAYDYLDTDGPSHPHFRGGGAHRAQRRLNRALQVMLTGPWAMMFLVALLCSAATRTVWADTQHGITVFAWAGPPANETTLERYRELAAAGFTLSYSGYPNANAQRKALDIAAKAGVKLLVRIPELRSTPREVAAEFKGHPAVGGYYLGDEPSVDKFPLLADWATKIQAEDRTHPCYVNLFPNYARPAQLGVATYEEYVRRFVNEVPVQIISFDNYPILGDGTLRPGWYENLETIANIARSTGKPFWAFVLSAAHADYPEPTLAGMRLQAFSNLAYGAQGIEWFTYWAPNAPDRPGHYHASPISYFGDRSSTYDLVKKVNDEIRGLSRVFYGSKVISVRHTGATIPKGTVPFASSPPIRVLETDGSGAVVSELEGPDHRFLVIVNRSLVNDMRLKVVFDTSVSVIQDFGKDGNPRTVDGSMFVRSVAPGDVEVFGWKVRRETP